jgi:hypothetical protein
VTTRAIETLIFLSALCLLLVLENRKFEIMKRALHLHDGLNELLRLFGWRLKQV